jgi:uncharacterized protein YceH (UPF0502 family)
VWIRVIILEPTARGLRLLEERHYVVTTLEKRVCNNQRRFCDATFIAYQNVTDFIIIERVSRTARPPY